jgi:hypothetical protein
MIRLFLAMAIALQVTASLAASGSAAPPAQFKILKTEFGVLSPGGFRPATKVPLKEGQSFGWVIQIETKAERVKWREEFALPAAPRVWQVDEKSGKHTLSPDRATSILEHEVKVEDGMIYNFWTIAPGDPRGRHKIRVMVEGFLVATFDFDVE